MIYNLYIFARDKCLFYEEWNRTRKPSDFEEEKKLVWGLVMTLKSITAQLSPSATPPPIQTFNSFSTPKYKMHILETATGYRFVINTDPSTYTDMQKALNHIYCNLFVPLVLKNPSWSLGHPVQCPHFTQQLKTYVQKRPEFSSFL
eukprot:GEMP01033168.1.p1 GENE.GEMP01033168.1~~GEMP01033168.1.p1  ORF type:complete len:168 (-),score=23.90 GEMP01033168.1:1621-2058(-)